MPCTVSSPCSGPCQCCGRLTLHTCITNLQRTAFITCVWCLTVPCLMPHCYTHLQCAVFAATDKQPAVTAPCHLHGSNKCRRCQGWRSCCGGRVLHEGGWHTQHAAAAAVSTLAAAQQDQLLQGHFCFAELATSVSAKGCTVYHRTRTQRSINPDPILIWLCYVPGRQAQHGSGMLPQRSL